MKYSFWVSYWKKAKRSRWVFFRVKKTGY
jgi:hypothetical protein